MIWNKFIPGEATIRRGPSLISPGEDGAIAVSIDGVNWKAIASWDSNDLDISAINNPGVGVAFWIESIELLKTIKMISVPTVHGQVLAEICDHVNVLFNPELGWCVVEVDEENSEYLSGADCFPLIVIPVLYDLTVADEAILMDICKAINNYIGR